MKISYDENVISDLHKDAYGFRPNVSFWGIWATFNVIQKQALWDSMIADLKRSIEREEEEQNAAIFLFEERIDNLISELQNPWHGKPNRKDVVAWLMNADDRLGDDEGFEFDKGLPFGYLKKMGYV